MLRCKAICAPSCPAALTGAMHANPTGRMRVLLSVVKILYMLCSD